MIYPIKIKPTPKIDGGKHKGEPITHLKVIDAHTVEVYTPDTVIKGSPYELLPLSVRRIMGHVIKQAKLEDNLRDELGEDLTYDNESTGKDIDKPEEEETALHPKERALREEQNVQEEEEPDEEDSREEELLETSKEDKFPDKLPSQHPKEMALEEQQQNHEERSDEEACE